MSLRLCLLGMLSHQNMTGYDLKKLADKTIAKFREAQTSQVYRELNYMEDIGWLTSIIEIQTEKPNKRIYSITDAGKQVFLDWIRESPLDEDKVNVSIFLMKTFFANERSLAENQVIFSQFRQACVDRLTNIEDSFQDLVDLRKTFPEHNPYAFYWDFTVDFEKAFYKMSIEWADKCIKQIEKQTAE
jgi:PadR family transcriptional regulator AphA